MFLLKSLGLVLAACAHAATTHRSLSDLYDDCKFTVDHAQYDLCPLFHDRARDGVVKVRAELAPTLQLSYEISFGGPLNPQSREEGAGPQCPPGTWICLRELQMDPKDPESYFAQAIPIAGPFAIVTPHTTTPTRLGVDAYRSTYNGDLELDLNEGMWRYQPQTAHFRFKCDQNAQEPSLPTFIGINAWTHSFEWSTPHGCAKEPLSFSALEEGRDTTPAGNDTQPGDGDGSQELVGSLPAHHTVRNLMIAFAVFSSAILGLGYLVRYPPPELKRWVGSTARKLPSRVGEGILVRWAEEAMFVNDEEDVMVNYEEEYNSDEQIPLKSSPTRLSARFADYGSARW